MRNRAGEFVILLGTPYDDDHPFFDVTVGSFAVYYGYPTFTYAASGGHVFLNKGDGPQGYVYFTSTILN